MHPGMRNPWLYILILHITLNLNPTISVVSGVRNCAPAPKNGHLSATENISFHCNFSEFHFALFSSMGKIFKTHDMTEALISGR